MSIKSVREQLNHLALEAEHPCGNMPFTLYVLHIPSLTQKKHFEFLRQSWHVTLLILEHSNVKITYYFII